MSQEERRIAEIEAEMARTQKNKGTEKHLGRLKGELAALRSRLAVRADGQRKARKARGAPNGAGGGAVVRREVGSISDIRRAMGGFQCEGSDAEDDFQGVDSRMGGQGGPGSCLEGGAVEAREAPGERVLILFSPDYREKLAFLRSHLPASGAGASYAAAKEAACLGSALIRSLDGDGALLLLFEGDDVRMGVLSLLAVAPKPVFEAPQGSPEGPGRPRGLGGSPVPPRLLCVLQALKLDYSPEIQEKAAKLLSSWLESLSVHDRRRLLVRHVVPELDRAMKLVFSPYSIPPFLRTGNPSREDTMLSLVRAMLLRSCAPFLALESGSFRAPEAQALKSTLLSLYRAALGGRAAEGYCGAEVILDLRGCVENALTFAILDSDQEREVASIRAELDRREDVERETAEE